VALSVARTIVGRIGWWSRRYATSLPAARLAVRLSMVPADRLRRSPLLIVPLMARGQGKRRLAATPERSAEHAFRDRFRSAGLVVANAFFASNRALRPIKFISPRWSRPPGRQADAPTSRARAFAVTDLIDFHLLNRGGADPQRTTSMPLTISGHPGADGAGVEKTRDGRDVIRSSTGRLSNIAWSC
jgi:hypothetical protein